MDQSALQEIERLALAADGQRLLDTPSPTAVLRGDEKLVSLEQYGAGRARYRGRFATTSLPAFIFYVNQQKDDGRQAFIDPETMSARVYFNLGTRDEPGHGDHTAELQLPKTAAFAALERAVKQRHSQRTLSDWVEDWRANLTPILDGKPTDQTIAQVVAAIRDITLKSAREVNTVERDMGATTSAMASVDAASKHTLPQGFLFSCEPYAGLPIQNFVLRLGMVTDDDKIALTLRLERAEAQQEEIATSFESVLADNLDKSVVVAIGTFAP